MSVKVTVDGDWSKTTTWLQKMVKNDLYRSLEGYAQEGVNALARNTPKDSGVTASSWTYEIVHNKRETAIIWNNTNVVNGVPVAILLQFGHATGNGGYVQGRDYINPALRPIFDKIAANVWKEVTK